MFRYDLARHVLDSLLEGCQVIGPDFRYLYVNEAAARQGRSTVAQLVGRTMMEAYPGIETTEVFAVARWCMEARQARQLENEFEFPDGFKGWFELRFEPVPEGIAILSIDIAQRKEAEFVLRRSAEADARLAQSESRYRLLVSNLNDVVFSAGVDGRFRYVSPAIERVYGYAPEEVVGRHFSDFVHPDDLAAVAVRFASTIQGTVEPLVFRGFDKLGRVRHLRSTSRSRFEHGECTGLDGVMVDVTDLHDAVEAERRSERRYRALFENTGIGIAYCRMLYADDTPVDFIYLDVNPAFATLTGLADVTGRRISELIPDIRTSDPKLFEVCGRVARGAPPERFEIYVEALRHWFDVSVYSPQVEHFVVVFDVVTGRKQAEASLLKFTGQLERLAAVVHALSQTRRVAEIGELVRHAARALVAADGAAFVLRDGDFCLCVDEDAVAPLWKGRRVPVSSCISGWCMVHDLPAVIEDVAADPRIPQDAFRATFVKSLVMVPMGRARSIGAIGCYWAETRHASAEDLRVLQALADATSVAMENVRFLRELEEGNARTRAIYDHLPVATYVWRVQGDQIVLTDVNEAARRAAQGDVTRLIGRSSQEVDLLPPQASEDIRACFETRSPSRREIEVAQPGLAKPRYLVLTCAFIPSDMVVLHCEDVTDQRQTEEHLRGIQRLEAVGRLAGGIAHDFNNLLSVILSYADLALEQTRDSAPLHARLAEIRRAGQRAADLTQQLLAFSRKQVCAPQALSLNSAVDDIVPMLRRLLGEDIEIVVRLANDLGSVMADRGQIEQVIMNLAVNARDAMPRGGRLTIETVNVELDDARAAAHVGGQPGSFVMLSVSDTGTGIDAETKKHMFEPFFTTKERGKGTGLGLATVYGIVKQSGGNIWVYSEVGRGAVFKVYLPRVYASPVALSRARTVVPAKGDETVLIVEDEPAVAALAEEILRGMGYQVLRAETSAEAERTFERSGDQIDLLLTDVVMPGMGGRELAERLLRTSPKLKVLFMSGYAHDALDRPGVLEPNLRFISKPFTAGQLARRVREVLDGVVTTTGADWPVITAEPIVGRPDRDDLRRVPQDVRERLRRAVATANVDEAYRSIDDIADQQPTLAAALRLLVESFDYTAIKVLLD